MANSRLLLFAVIGAVGYLLFVNLDSESFTIRTIKSALGDDPLPVRLVIWDQMDHVADEPRAARDQAICWRISLMHG
ncbi:MAG TPA: hypothetical protein VHD56_15225 [Tepidisphaeraceae bacterium]|nr:hypothetical protein [Tepidisphaeraceae bacterium]